MALPSIQKVKSRLATLLRGLNGKDSLVFGVLVLSAVLVTGVRIVAPFEVGKDQSTQLEVAQRVAAGQGITTTNFVYPQSNDISAAPASRSLTTWPPGFSLLVAILLYAGLPLLTALKIIYSIVTLLGWVGWAIIASHLISRGPNYKKSHTWIHLTIAALLPFIFTPWWDGTDIFLWAGIPFVFIGIVGFKPEQPSLVAVALAGLLFGCLYAIRYTSLFLGLAAIMILLQVSYPQIKIFLKRSSVFLMAALTVILPVTMYLMGQAEAFQVAPVKPNQVVEVPWGFVTTLNYILGVLHVMSNLILGHPVLEQTVNRLKTSWVTYATGFLCLGVILSWPILFWRSAASRGVKVKNDLGLSLSLLPLSLVIFMIGIGFAVQPYYLKFRRYYEPLALCGIFIFYQLATRRSTYGLVRKASRLMVLGFVLYACIYQPALAFSRERSESLAAQLRILTAADAPKIYSPRESVRTKVRQLYKDNPQALFYVQPYAFFIYDGFQGGPVPGESLRLFPDEDFWRTAYTTRPVKVFWIVSQEVPLDFVPDSSRQLIYSDSVEDVKILTADFSAGPLFGNGHIAENR